jgi:hypothetical protein
MFVYWAFEDQGSGLVIQGYTEAARALGHEVVVYGPANPRIPLNFTMDVGSVDAIVFVFEWTNQLRYGSRLYEWTAKSERGDSIDFVRLMGQVPRRRRIVLDGDGNYNERLCVDGDCNHRDAAASRRWIDVCDSLTDKICQPTLHPLRRNVRPFLFYAYDPAWEQALDSRAKEFGMVYVGHSKFRWRPMHRVLRAVEPVRDKVGRIALVGDGWDALPRWAASMRLETTYYSDPDYLKNLGVEFVPAVPFTGVINWMSKGVFNPVLLRPTFEHLRFVTPRLFETPAANTIPLFAMAETHVREVYGAPAAELVLGDGAAETVRDLMRRPEHYLGVVRGIREHLAANHSHAVRLRELLQIIES